MTRLKSEWIKDIKNNLFDFEKDLFEKTGCSLKELSSLANEITIAKIDESASNFKVAVIPITAGQGITPFFSESVAAIINHLGFDTFITEKKDIDGIYEAYKEEATCIFLADDNRFIGINTKNSLYVDNVKATAKGYVTLMEQACGGLYGKEILILGYGKLGRKIFSLLEEKGAISIIYDKDTLVLAGLDKRIILTNTEQIGDYPLIFDATDEGYWMEEEMIYNSTFIASPGRPLSMGEELFGRYKDRIIHDLLQIGVAVMIGELCR